MKTRKEIKAEAYSCIKQDSFGIAKFFVGQMVLVSVVPSLIAVLSVMNKQTMQASSVADYSVGTKMIYMLVYGFTWVVLTAPAQLAMSKYALAKINGEQGSDLFWFGWRKENFARSLVAWLAEVGADYAVAVLVFLVLLIPAIFLSVASGGLLIPLVALSFLLVTPLVYVLICWIDSFFTQAMFLLNATEDLTGWQAVKLSAKMMKGHQREYVKLMLSFVGRIILVSTVVAFLTIMINIFDSSGALSGLVTMVLVAAFLAPHIMLTRAVYYRELVAEQAAAISGETQTPAQPEVETAAGENES